MQALFLVAFVGIVAVIVLRLTDTASRRSEESQAADRLTQISAATEAPTDSQKISAEMQALLDQNEDFVGIIGFEDMAMYVCQGDDNSWYASHRLDGTADPAGMIYMDFRCGADSENIILYGHNMRDGTRFGKLNRYADVDYLLANPTVRFAGLHETREYRIFAVIRTHVNPDHPDFFDFARTDFADASDFERFISDARALALYHIPVAVEYGERLLTLATCEESETGSRLVIFAREERSS